MARQRRPSRLRDAGGVSEGDVPLKSWSFFENVGSNEAIWCTIFHHVNHLKHLTACLLRWFFFTLEQDRQKSGGAMPPSLKSGGATGPLPRPRFRRLWKKFSQIDSITKVKIHNLSLKLAGYSPRLHLHFKIFPGQTGARKTTYYIESVL